MNTFRLFLFILSITFSYADTILIDDKKAQYEILSKSQIYIDHDRKLTIDDVASGKVEFVDNDKSVLGFGYSPDFNVWVKFTLKNDTDKTIKRIIEYDNPLTTNIIFYNNGKNVREGTFNTFDKRNSLTPIFKIDLKPNEEKVFYLEIFTDVTTLIVKLNIWSNDKFYEKEIMHQIILALFFGAMFVLALYNLIIYFFTKDISYMFYVMYIFGIILHQLIYVGVARLYVFDVENFIAVFNFASIIVIIPAIALGLFTKTFLGTHQYKKIDKGLDGLLILVPILGLIFVFTNEYDKYRNLLAIILFGYLLFITIYAFLKKNKQAIFILFGWSVVLIASLLMFLSSSGLFNVFTYFPYIVEIAFISEAVIFSIALAYKIRQLEKEKNEMNDRLLLHEKQEGKRLKIQVAEKTKDLKEALEEKELLFKELHHRIKNNMQMIVSIVELQSQEVPDEKMKNIFTTIQSRIYAMGQIHDLLYQEEANIFEIDAYEYFDRIIDELRFTYESEEIDLRLNINARLEISQAIYCGLILNELITNSIKYAFKDKQGEIFVSLEHTAEQYKFHIEDNGIGFDSKKDTGSLGLLLVDTLVKNQLKGKLKVDSKDGAKVDIVWGRDGN